MKRNLLPYLIVIFIFVAKAHGQVGINTNSPSTTLQVVGKPSTTTVADGVTIPSLTGDQLKAKDDNYTSSQSGTLVYVSSAVTSTSTKTANVNAAGFYYFNGTVWQRVANTSSGQLLNTVFLDDPAMILPANFQSDTYTDLISYSYTPVSNNSKILVQYHNNSYTISGGVGPGADEFQSQLLMPTSRTINTQLCSAANTGNSSFRTGSLFPISGVAENTGTTPITIKVQIRKSSGDDNINFNGTNGTLIIQEIAQ